VSAVFSHVEVPASPDHSSRVVGLRGVSECDSEASTDRRALPTGRCCVTGGIHASSSVCVCV